MSEPEGFLGRWSRRKQADKAPVEAEQEAEQDAEQAEEVVEAAAPAIDERGDDEILAELGLPDPDTLKPGDDIRGFMQAAVPERLRRVALRQLWRSNPILANLDGLVDYGEDFTDSATVVENMQTLYRVGKGMWSKITEPDEGEDGEVAEAAPEEAEPVEAEPVEAEPVETEELAASEPPLADEIDPEPELPPIEEIEPEIVSTQRRMVFRFET